MTIEPKQREDDVFDVQEKAIRDRARRSGWGKPRPWLSVIVGAVMLAVAANAFWQAGGVEVYALVLAAAGLANLWIGNRGLRTRERRG